ncbi:hypothetical protein FHX82_005197 [Amycolatopsis bartoniae]|uniref:hypothetical protein n=1 Tax=Amycolatopsis bartoniae TaxID=941986 RepID=UPI00181E916E|nr:hypothetical protein [Amycolatopsis bartoniae]MBB2938121.1 hypothetical protein [Amycolatopsis bartoniae]
MAGEFGAGILENLRYTGYAFFGRWARQEMLRDPEDVSAGHMVRFRRAAAEKAVRSRTPAHPEIISVEVFTEVQLLRRSRAAGGFERAAQAGTWAKANDQAGVPVAGKGAASGSGTRRMEGTPREDRTYYRCAAGTLVPGSPTLNRHPKNVYLRDAAVTELLNTWLGEVFAPENRDRTVKALVASQGGAAETGAHDAARHRLEAAEAKLRRLRSAIEAGVDPAALVEVINDAQAQRTAARAELDGASAPSVLTPAEVYAMIDSLDRGRPSPHRVAAL